MINYYYKSFSTTQIEKLKSFKKGCVVFSVTPSDRQIKSIVKQTGIQKDFILDSLDPFEVPRYEIEDSILYIFVRFPLKDNEEVSTIPLLIAISSDCITLISSKPIPQFQVFLETNINTTQKTKFILNLLLFIDSLYKKEIHSVSKKIMNLSRNIENIDNKEIIRFVQYEYILNLFLSSLLPTTLVLEKLMQSKKLNYVEEEKDLVEDLLLSNNQLVEICKQNNRFIVNIRDAYTNIITNNLNKVIKLLTAFTLIFTIPTFIASFFGTNVKLPFENDPFAYLYILGIIVLTTLVLTIIFFKKKLL